MSTGWEGTKAAAQHGDRRQESAVIMAAGAAGGLRPVALAPRARTAQGSGSSGGHTGPGAGSGSPSPGQKPCFGLRFSR